uniref:Retroviral polymerase SH3-like domain-containing protein n=1 Tax=Peronospora matthiolae TaxID=2874970 RepID=A0AAV1V0P1_9STRA
MTAVYIKNRLPSPKCQDQTRFEIVNGFRPSVKHVRVFGCRTFVLTPKEKRSKWDPKARVGRFMGYEEVSKAYRVYDIEADQVVISRDVTFDESTFGFSPTLPQEIVDDTALDVESMNTSDAPHPMEFKQIGKRKSRSNAKNKFYNGHFLSFVEPGSKKQVWQSHYSNVVRGSVATSLKRRLLVEKEAMRLGDPIRRWKMILTGSANRSNCR